MVQPVPAYDEALHSSQLLNQLIASLTPRQSTAAPTVTAKATGAANPFFDAMRSSDPILQVNRPTLHATPSTENLTLTENGGVTLLSTQSPTLDLYLELGTADKSTLPELIEAAWASDPLETLKVAFNTRSIGRGKGSKEGFVRLLSYLREHHPQTLLNNLDQIVLPLDAIPKKKKEKVEGEDAPAQDEDLCEVDEEEEEELTPRTARSHGSYKDLLDILVLATLPSKRSPSGTEFHIDGDFSRVPGYDVESHSIYAEARHKSKKRKTSRTISTATATSTSVATPSVAELTLEDNEDPFNRALRLRVATIFGEALKKDLENLKAGKLLMEANETEEGRKVLSRISLAAKWAPTNGNFHDKVTSITTNIAEYLSPTAIDPSRSPSSVTKALMIYRKQYLVPLRAHLEVVERRMSANDWENIKYNRVPSIAMQKNKQHFIKHDGEGFKKYLMDVASGKASISGAVSTPATLLLGGIRGSDVENEVGNAQFQTLVQSLRDSGTLSEAIGMADVSGSMMSPRFRDGTTPLDSSIALSILISQVTEAPFNDSIISFTDVPAFIDLNNGGTLEEKYNQIVREGTGYNTNFIAAFDLILSKALRVNLAPEKMVKKIFAFSDMQFDAADEGHEEYDTHYDIIERKFHEAGYEVPQLVFWNLAGPSRHDTRTSKPVDKSRKGCAMVSGYSASTLKVFLEGGEFEEEEESWEEVNEEGEVVKVKKAEMTPESLMRKALAHPSFNGLKVFD